MQFCVFSQSGKLSKKRSRLGQCIYCSLFWRAASPQMKPVPGGCKSLLSSWHSGTGPGTAAAAAMPDGLRLEQRFVPALGAPRGRLGVPRTSTGGSPGCSLSPRSSGCSGTCPALWCPLQPTGRAGERGRDSCGSCRASQAMGIGNPAGDSCFR